ncbi:MAG TPA: hypothetical protein VNY31_08380 [Solirubrobacteraceae bacterium]|jgi:hypothetical protein|nr:hypothetical protein [Solirubrobacteraceae bacterium]
MIVKKVLLVASAAALMSTPAWALPSQAPSNQGTAHAPSTTPVGPPSTTPANTNNPGAANRSSHGDHSGENGEGHKGNGSERSVQSNGSDDPPNKPSHPGKSHKCKPHNVGYVASGTLVSQTLTKNADGTYSGEVTVKVTHANHHAIGDLGTTKTYKVENVHVTFGLMDTNKDGSVGLDDLKEGDRVKLIGKIAALAKRCDQSGFTATMTIRKVVFHAPPVG